MSNLVTVTAGLSLGAAVLGTIAAAVVRLCMNSDMEAAARNESIEGDRLILGGPYAAFGDV